MTIWGIVQKARELLANLGIATSTATAETELREVFFRLQPLAIERPLIRVGGDSDGGYLVPDDFVGIDALFSPGVADTADFEMHFANLGIPCYLIDGSVTDSPSKHPKILFEPLWLGSETVGGLSTTLDDWVEKYRPGNSDLILQIDIEGAEYRSLLAAKKETLERFRIIVLELHDFQSVTNRMGSRLVSILLDTLNKSHELVHAHANNTTKPFKVSGIAIPDTVELTFFRRDRFTSTGNYASLPHPLDSPNTSNADWHLSWE